MSASGRLLFGKIAGSGELWARHLDPETGVAQDQLAAPRVLHIDGGVLLGGWGHPPWARGRRDRLGGACRS